MLHDEVTIKLLISWWTLSFECVRKLFLVFLFNESKWISISYGNVETTFATPTRRNFIDILCIIDVELLVIIRFELILNLPLNTHDPWLDPKLWLHHSTTQPYRRRIQAVTWAPIITQSSSSLGLLRLWVVALDILDSPVQITGVGVGAHVCLIRYSKRFVNIFLI